MSGCVLCQGSSQSTANGGTILSKDGISAHHYCLYFASGLAQRGDEKRGEGLSGFLPQDILKEVRRSLLLSCVVCGRRGASIGCAVKRCRCVGHYSCLQNSGYIFQHFDNFKAFCPKHSPTQRAVKLSQSDCPVCLEAINAEPGFHQISCPHCKTYFHRSCIQDYATSAGSFYMRCPVCSDKADFVQEMLTMGIALPEKDAEWELNGQFLEDMEASKYCRAKSCHCPYGRSHHSGIGMYKMRKCISCGQWTGHVLCLKGRSEEQCEDCIAIPIRPSAERTTTLNSLARVCEFPSRIDSSSNSRLGCSPSSPRVSTRKRDKSLAVSIPLKRLHYRQLERLKVIVPSAHGRRSDVKSIGSVHPTLKALSQKYPRVKVLSSVSLPLYTPRFLRYTVANQTQGNTLKP